MATKLGEQGKRRNRFLTTPHGRSTIFAVYFETTGLRKRIRRIMRDKHGFQETEIL